ncbi:MAG: ABC transporter substrate-binding protein, partial [Nakamurella sp.]
MSPRHFRKPAGALAVLTAALVLAGCAGSTTAPGGAAGSESAATQSGDTATPTPGGRYVHALEADPLGCLDPAQQRYHVALNITRQLSDSLVDQDPETGEIVPWLAKSWEVSPDATAFTFHLADGATF